MKVNEIFLSVQGEGLSSGFPTIFVRFTGCNLRCSYCDTTYSYNDGVEMPPEDILKEIKKLHYKRVCLTGGEPLLQEDIEKLLKMLYDYTVTIETNGSVRLDSLDLSNRKYSFVMDMKTPSSGCSGEMVLENFKLLKSRDEIKFVIGDREDYEWSKNIILNHYKKGTITFSPVYNRIDYAKMVKWILDDRLDVRFQLQLHKFIWGPDVTGV
ncbi:7-carboxy-7-deazaguanine synthase QueE [Acetivibrio saccincola]|uniref:7-carboxy-7-deazaguanine synthase n=1 Tax=Acetivibrio saccincola TaxID=1677857 RepID=A0A2S8REE3_9FIRM|nr:radical SAM protein [Acetivibrio saccincola]PQQ68156.1 radical SAM protein [Acetivibrio saccincola]